MKLHHLNPGKLFAGFSGFIVELKVESRISFSPNAQNQQPDFHRSSCVTKLVILMSIILKLFAIVAMTHNFLTSRLVLW